MKQYKYLKDAIYGGIVIQDELIFELYNSKEFKRLGRIKHLGVSDFIYPSATHTRLSHSLGVYYLAYKSLDVLLPEINLSTKRAFLSAALLHDIGHGPLSHNFEMISKTRHEDLTIKIIETETTEIFKIFEKLDPQAAIETVQMIKGEHKLDWANKLISSEIDLDRLDYLNRDTLFTGATYGLTDWKYIVKKMKLVGDKLVFSHKALPALEAMLLGRFHMNEAVYHNNVNESFSQLAPFFFNRLHQLDLEGSIDGDLSKASKQVRDENLSINDFQLMDDSFILRLLNISVDHEDKILSKISQAFLNRIAPEIISGTEQELKEWAKDQDQTLKGCTWNYFTIKEEWSFYSKDINKEFYIKDSNGDIKRGSEISMIINKLGDQKRLHKKAMLGVKLK